MFLLKLRLLLEYMSDIDYQFIVCTAHLDFTCALVLFVCASVLSILCVKGQYEQLLVMPAA